MVKAALVSFPTALAGQLSNLVRPLLVNRVEVAANQDVILFDAGAKLDGVVLQIMPASRRHNAKPLLDRKTVERLPTPHQLVLDEVDRVEVRVGFRNLRQPLG